MEFSLSQTLHFKNEINVFFITDFVHKPYIYLLNREYFKCYICCISAGVFVLLQVYAFLQYLKDRLTRQEFQTLFFLGVSVAAGVVFLSVIYLTYTGWFKLYFRWLVDRLALSYCTFFATETQYLNVKMMQQHFCYRAGFAKCNTTVHTSYSIAG